MDSLKRRDFIKRLLALSAAALAAQGCGGAAEPSAEQTADTRSTPTQMAAEATRSGARLTPSAIPPKASATPARTDTKPAPTAGPAESPTITPAASTAAYLAVARGSDADPGELARRAVAALGGIERFVKNGANVIIKPNICNAHRGPEYATTTNPDIVAALVSLCLGAGAARVRVIDYNFSGANPQAYTKSGIEAAVHAAGGEMELINRMRFRKTLIHGGVKIKELKVYGDVLDADVVINVPIAKQHSSGTLTLGMKNLMGIIDERMSLHARGLHECIVDLNRAVRPQLTIVDAVRVLTANGPTGGSLDDVKRLDTVIASTDIVAADSYAATLFGLTARDVAHIRLAGEAGLGQMDLSAIKIEEIDL